MTPLKANTVSKKGTCPTWLPDDNSINYYSRYLGKLSHHRPDNENNYFDIERGVIIIILCTDGVV